MEPHYQYFVNAASNFLTLIGATSLAVLPGIASFIVFSLRKHYRLTWLLIFPIALYISIFFLVVRSYSKLLSHLAENKCSEFIKYWLNYNIFGIIKSFEHVIWWGLLSTTLILGIMMLVIHFNGEKK